MKISVPVAVLAANSPMIRPRLVANQRLTTVAPSTMATQPVPRPDNTPQVTIRCHGSVMKALAAIETDIRMRALIKVRLTPKVCIRAAANGPTMPYRKMPRPAENDVTLRLQPNACSSGWSRTPGADRMPAAARRARNTTPTTTKA